jgi:hypothetical protein
MLFGHLVNNKLCFADIFCWLANIFDDSDGIIFICIPGNSHLRKISSRLQSELPVKARQIQDEAKTFLHRPISGYYFF